MFIQIEPEEVETIRSIPEELLFQAPWRPEGHLLMGYNEKGHCPMLVDNQCSIYDARPQTCRDYDCRVFAATGVAVDVKRQPDIAKRVAAWVFEHDSAESREEEARLKSAAAFLCQNRDLFPPDSISYNPSEVALLAIGIYKAFPGESTQTDAEIARALSVEMDRIEAIE
jgi:Fe-S-cluster containining protein